MSTDPRLPPAAAQLKTACEEVSGAILHEALSEIRRKPEQFSPAAIGILEAELKSPRRRVGLKNAFRDPDAPVVAERPPGNSSTAAIAIALAFLLTSSVYVWMFVLTEGGRPPARPTSSQAIAFRPANGPRKLTSSSLSTVLSLTNDENADRRDEAVFELGRRGAVAELERLESHPLSEVRAAVPLAILLAGKTAHSRIPHLADRLTSPDESVRRNTITALRTLVARFGTYRGAVEVAVEGNRSASRR